MSHQIEPKDQVQYSLVSTPVPVYLEAIPFTFDLKPIKVDVDVGTPFSIDLDTPTDMDTLR
jgi:hypothetical protein